MPPEGVRAPDERSGRPGEVREHLHAAARLLPDLLARVQFVRMDIPGIAKLIGAEGASFAHKLLRPFLDERQVFARHLPDRRPRRLVHENDLGPERGHHPRAFHRVSLRHHGDERIPLDAAHNGESRSRVAARQLHDRLSRPQGSGRLGLLDHPESDPVLLAEARVQVFELRENPPIQLPRRDETGQIHKRRFAYGLKNALENRLHP